MPNPTLLSQLLTVRIVSPREIIFQGQAHTMSSVNSQGPFDILPSHANFITLIENAPLTIRKIDKQAVQFQFPFAILYIRDNLVDIYTDIQIQK